MAFFSKTVLYEMRITVVVYLHSMLFSVVISALNLLNFII